MVIEGLVRDAIKGELETKNSRINWLLITQTFMFAGFGIFSKFVFDNTQLIKPAGDTFFLLGMIPIFGIFMSLLTLAGITGCYIAANRLSQVHQKLINTSELEYKDHYRILIFKNSPSVYIGVIYSYVLCFGFLVLWILAFMALNGSK